MTPTAASTRTAAVRTPIPTPRRFLRCLACGTVKKERSYALCSECFSSGPTPLAGTTFTRIPVLVSG